MSSNNAASNKIIIIGLENGVTVTAQYNPKEIGLDKSVPWQKGKNSKANTPDLEFTSADGRSLSVELFFDGFEDNKDVHAAYVSKLLKLAEVMDENGSEEKKRPTRVKVKWGTLPEFEGVLESVSTKYTMFTPDGKPVRCTCSCKFKEASRLSFKKGA